MLVTLAFELILGVAVLLFVLTQVIVPVLFDTQPFPLFNRRRRALNADLRKVRTQGELQDIKTAIKEEKARNEFR